MTHRAVEGEDPQTFNRETRDPSRDSRETREGRDTGDNVGATEFKDVRAQQGMSVFVFAR